MSDGLTDMRRRRAFAADSIRPIIGFAAACAVIAVSLAGAGLVLSGDVTRFDRDSLLALRNADQLSDPLGPLALESFMRDVTGLGSFGVLTLIVLATAAFLALRGRSRLAGAFTAVCFGGWLVSHGTKLLLARPRPDLVPHDTEFWNASLPSGHAMVSTVVFLTLALLANRSLMEPRLRTFTLAVAFGAIVLIGVSRVYLGVHWPTDVLAGWALGATWTAVMWRWLANVQG